MRALNATFRACDDSYIACLQNLHRVKPEIRFNFLKSNENHTAGTHIAPVDAAHIHVFVQTVDVKTLMTGGDCI